MLKPQHRQPDIKIHPIIFTVIFFICFIPLVAIFTKYPGMIAFQYGIEGLSLTIDGRENLP